MRRTNLDNYRAPGQLITNDGMRTEIMPGQTEMMGPRGLPGLRHFDPHTPAPIHRGKGPKSYKRADERILEDICRRMSENRYLDATNVDVKVDAGEVVIEGTVASRYEKRLAEDLSDTAYGVTNVENRLRISS